MSMLHTLLMTGLCCKGLNWWNKGMQPIRTFPMGIMIKKEQAGNIAFVGKEEVVWWKVIIVPVYTIVKKGDMDPVCTIAEKVGMDQVCATVKKEGMDLVCTAV